MVCNPSTLVRTLALTTFVFAMGCSPEIGDECTTALDCSPLGDRLCDISQPGGYCTEFNCEPDRCSEEAVCVAFNADLDPTCYGLDDSRYGRFGRSFCMRICEDQSDCRGGYECVKPAERVGSVLDKVTETSNPQDTKICLAIGQTPQLPGQDASPMSCMPNDSSELPTPYGAGGAGGTGGAGGSGGAGGAGGAGGSGGN